MTKRMGPGVDPIALLEGRRVRLEAGCLLVIGVRVVRLLLENLRLELLAPNSGIEGRPPSVVAA